VRALWLEDRKLSLRDIDVPTPPPGEVLVRVLAAGICNTDIELTRGYYPYMGVPGHEFVGEVDGQRVVGEINAVCHQCAACRAGRKTHCEHRNVLGIINRNGAFAQYLTLPRENLHAVPDSVPTEEAVFAEPLAAALEIQEQVRIAPTDRVLVVGKGKLGTLIAQTVPGHVTAIGRNDPAPAPQSFDVAIEASGNPDGFATARAALRPRGTLVMKSTYAGDLTVNASSLVVDEITLVGSRCGPMDKALRLLAERRVDVRSMIHASYALDDAIAAFEHAQKPRVLKVLVRTG
jgi:threonine dehydrogenase-like Zn-dependent dehydrogenase